MKNYILITGGAGFIGTNLIKILLKKTSFRIISLDNYSTGIKRNHIKNKKVKYLKGDTRDISRILNKYKSKIHSTFHFGEFSRIYQSFKYFNECLNSNLIGTKEVFNFCFINKIKIIYSATSASLGNNGNDKDLSPYAFTKAKNLELLVNLKKWFNYKYEVIYFYNVYGNHQIETGEMATVVGIFEKAFKDNTYLPVVKPGTQTRRFTHVDDTVNACFYAWKKNKNLHYSILSKDSISIIELAKLFKKKIKYLKPRKGERFASAIINKNLSNNIQKIYSITKIRDYVARFISNN